MSITLVRTALSPICVLVLCVGFATHAAAEDLVPPGAEPLHLEAQGPATSPLEHELPAAAFDREFSGADVATAGLGGNCGCADPCSTCNTNPCCGSRRPWSLSLDILGSLVQEDPEGILGEPLPAAAAAPLNALDWGLNDYDLLIGGRIGVNRWFGCTSRVEARLTWYGVTSDESRQTGNFAYTNANGISPTVTATLESEITLGSIDVMYWRRFGNMGGLETSAGVGLAYLRIEEEATVRDIVGLTPTSRLDTEASSGLLALAIGGDVRRSFGRFELAATGRGYVGYLATRTEIDENSILSGGGKSSAETNNEDFGWALELSAMARVRLGNRMWLRGGYQFLYFPDAARAAGGADFSQANTGAVQARIVTDDIFVHTLFLGIDIDL